MKKSLLALGATLLFTLAANASVLATQTVSTAQFAAVYDTFHDARTGFVFVRLPEGWRFVAQDTQAQAHAVFYDVSTDFVFVQLSSGWVFVPRT